MKTAPIPADEAVRLAKLRSLSVLDTTPELPFENVARLACSICETPIAVVSLVDADRQWFKARVGLVATETSRDVSFCAHSVALDEQLIVPDASLDPRFCDNPLVSEDPHIRFYAGVPLRVEGGSPIGTLCVIDRQPRVLSEQQLDALGALAKQVEVELGLRRDSARHQAVARGALESEAAAPSPTPSPAPVPVDVLAPTVRPPKLAVRTPLLGELLAGRYLVDEALGAGGEGVVLRGTDSFSGRAVAIKLLHQTALSDPRMVERFVREARSLASLHSKHIAKIFDVGNLPHGQPFIVMEFLPGIELEELLRSRGALDIALARELLTQAAEGVGVAHQAGIVHRDVKPSNMVLAEADGERVLKLLDFGLAKPSLLTADPGLTTVEDLVGTCFYMSPEQVIGSATVDARSDVWSLGVVGYQMLTGRLPFEGSGTMQVCSAIVQNAVVSVRDVRAEVPERLSWVVMACLQRAPDRRFPDAVALARALRELPDR